jgi:hypothetical protein
LIEIKIDCICSKQRWAAVDIVLEITFGVVSSMVLNTTSLERSSPFRSLREKKCFFFFTQPSALQGCRRRRAGFIVMTRQPASNLTLPLTISSLIAI